MEVAVLLLWVLGITCAILATRYLASRKSRLLLLAVAVFLPVLGSLAAIAGFGILVAGKRRKGPAGIPRREHPRPAKSR